jgi:DNA-binding response OmpR family regulator
MRDPWNRARQIVMPLNLPGQFRNVGSVICGRQPMETAMTTQKARRLAELTNQLAETLMTAAICAQEIRTEIHAELNGNDGAFAGQFSNTSVRNGARCNQRPVLDQSTLCVIWREKSLHLGHTRPFWVLDRLSRCPNQYVTYTDLLQDVWDDEELADATVRSAVRHLRTKLREGGMGELAEAIRSHRGRYILSV